MRNTIRYQVTVPLQAWGLRLAPARQPLPGEPETLAVEVVYTTDEGTQYALRRAWQLAQNLGVHVRLVFVCAVPYTLPIGKPAVSITFLQNKLVELARDFPGEVSVHIFLCREALRALQDALHHNSLVVLGGRRHWWWPTKGQRIEKQLKKLGHQVIFAEAGRSCDA